MPPAAETRVEAAMRAPTRPLAAEVFDDRSGHILLSVFGRIRRGIVEEELVQINPPLEEAAVDQGHCTSLAVGSCD